MPTLQFKGRNVIWNHHLSVPYHTLDEVKELAVNLKKVNGNLLIEGDNLIALKALLPFYAGNIDCIYIDPPFDSKADYRTMITLPNGDIEQRPTVIEQFAYSDTWKDGTASYLKMMYPRLILMRELLSDKGSIYVHIDWHVGHYVKILLDEIFGKENFLNENIWYYRRWNIEATTFARNHDWDERTRIIRRSFEVVNEFLDTLKIQPFPKE